MSGTKKANTAPRVTALADTNLVTILDPTSGALSTIEFGSLKQAIRDSIQIGGRNYVRNSGTYGNAANDGTYKGLGVYTSSDYWAHPAIPLSEVLEVGETYTLSYYFKGGNHHISTFSKVCIFDTSSEWRRNILTVTVKPTEAFDTIRIIKGVSQDPGNPLSICGLKLERGNMATDWTPAPEDFGGGVNTALSECYNLATRLRESSTKSLCQKKGGQRHEQSDQTSHRRNPQVSPPRCNDLSRNRRMYRGLCFVGYLSSNFILYNNPDSSNGTLELRYFRGFHPRWRHNSAFDPHRRLCRFPANKKNRCLETLVSNRNEYGNLIAGKEVVAA